MAAMRIEFMRIVAVALALVATSACRDWTRPDEQAFADADSRCSPLLARDRTDGSQAPSLDRQPYADCMAKGPAGR
jgi:hypothetical protein